MENKISNGFEMVQDLIKLRWIPEILKSLEVGNCRYTDIKESIYEISHTELNRKLSLLVEKKVVTKKENLENQVCYVLLDLGKDLVHIFNHLEYLEEKYFENHS